MARGDATDAKTIQLTMGERGLLCAMKARKGVIENRFENKEKMVKPIINNDDLPTAVALARAKWIEKNTPCCWVGKVCFRGASSRSVLAVGGKEEDVGSLSRVAGGRKERW